MDAPPRETPEFRKRGDHRLWLAAHFVALVFGLGGAAILNRVLSPEKFWVQWVAIAWGTVFVVHLVIFARATLATLAEKQES